MADTTTIDVYPVTLRGPLSTNSSRVVTFARIFTHNGRLYVAESGNKGRDIRVVSSYPLPEEEFIRRGTKAAKWGPWSWSSCGCSSSWNMHTAANLAAMDTTPAETPAESGV